MVCHLADVLMSLDRCTDVLNKGTANGSAQGQGDW